MEKINALIGHVQVFKAGTVLVQALGQKQDVYIAKLKNDTTNKIALIAFVPSEKTSLQYNVVSQLKWSSLHVRSYTTEKNFLQAMKKVASDSQIAELETQQVPFVDWGNQDDVVLVTKVANKSNSVYEADLPYVVTLHSQYSDNKFGTELEHEIELIPALQTYNFSLSK